MTHTSVFVSYSRRDQEQVRTIADVLLRAGFLIWLDQSALLPGENWLEKIRQAIAGSDVILFMMSSHSVVSSYCQLELDIAQALKLPIIPVQLHPDLELPPDLRDLNEIQFADFSTGDSQDNITRLAVGITRLVDKRSSPPTSDEIANTPVTEPVPAANDERAIANAPTDFTLTRIGDSDSSGEHPDSTRPVDLRAVPDSPAWLEGTAGEVKGKYYAIEQETLTCGRLFRNNVHLVHPQISRQHFVIWCHSATYYIEDMRSSLGTYLNGHRIKERQILNDNDRIRVHEAEFVFRQRAH